MQHLWSERHAGWDLKAEMFQGNGAEGSWEVNMPIPLSSWPLHNSAFPLTKGMKGHLHLKAALREKCAFKIPNS